MVLSASAREKARITKMRSIKHLRSSGKIWFAFLSIKTSQSQNYLKVVTMTSKSKSSLKQAQTIGATLISGKCFCILDLPTVVTFARVVSATPTAWFTPFSWLLLRIKLLTRLLSMRVRSYIKFLTETPRRSQATLLASFD